MRRFLLALLLGLLAFPIAAGDAPTLKQYFDTTGRPDAWPAAGSKPGAGVGGCSVMGDLLRTRPQWARPPMLGPPDHAVRKSGR